MSQANAPLSNDILRSLDLIRSTDPQERKRAVSILSSVRSDPRVQQVFEHLYAKDPDPGVRHAAWQALQQSEPAVPAPGAGAAPARANGTAAPAPRQRRPSTMVRRRAGRRGMFLVNPANARLVSREVRRAAKRKQGGRSALVLASVLLLVVGLLWGMVAHDWYTALRLSEDGRDVSGQVTGRQVSGGHHYSVQYRYEVEQNRFTGSQPVAQSDYERLDTGSKVTVTYVSGDVAVSSLSQSNPDHDLRNRLTIAAAGLSAITLLVLVLGILQRTRPHVLRGGWRLIKGQVVACQGRVDDDGDFKIVLRYRFRSPSKRVITTQVRQIRNDLRSKSLPRPGSPVAVYYRSDKKYRML
jgi:hypothetical protein